MSRSLLPGILSLPDLKPKKSKLIDRCHDLDLQLESDLASCLDLLFTSPITLSSARFSTLTRQEESLVLSKSIQFVTLLFPKLKNIYSALVDLIAVQSKEVAHVFRNVELVWKLLVYGDGSKEAGFVGLCNIATQLQSELEIQRELCSSLANGLRETKAEKAKLEQENEYLKEKVIEAEAMIDKYRNSMTRFGYGYVFSSSSSVEESLANERSYFMEMKSAWKQQRDYLELNLEQMKSEYEELLSAKVLESQIEEDMSPEGVVDSSSLEEVKDTVNLDIKEQAYNNEANVFGFSTKELLSSNSIDTSVVKNATNNTLDSLLNVSAGPINVVDSDVLSTRSSIVLSNDNNLQNVLSPSAKASPRAKIPASPRASAKLKSPKTSSIILKSNSEKNTLGVPKTPIKGTSFSFPDKVSNEEGLKISLTTENIEMDKNKQSLSLVDNLRSPVNEQDIDIDENENELSLKQRMNQVNSLRRILEQYANENFSSESIVNDKTRLLIDFANSLNLAEYVIVPSKDFSGESSRSMSASSSSNKKKSILKPANAFSIPLPAELILPSPEIIKSQPIEFYSMLDKRCRILSHIKTVSDFPHFTEPIYPISYIVKWIRSIYSTLFIIRESASSHKSDATKLANMIFPDFVYFVNRTKYGLSQLNDSKLWGILSSTSLLRSENEEIELFSEYLEERRNSVSLDRFLLFRSTVEQSHVGLRIPSSAVNNCPKEYICQNRCLDVIKQIFEKYPNTQSRCISKINSIATQWSMTDLSLKQKSFVSNVLQKQHESRLLSKSVVPSPPISARSAGNFRHARFNKSISVNNSITLPSIVTLHVNKTDLIWDNSQPETSVSEKCVLYSSFQKIIIDEFSMTELEQSMAAWICAMFDFVDSNKDGYINRDEFFEVFETLNPKKSQKEVHEMFVQCLRDSRDNTELEIQYPSFSKIIKQVVRDGYSIHKIPMPDVIRENMKIMGRH